MDIAHRFMTPSNFLSIILYCAKPVGCYVPTISVQPNIAAYIGIDWSDRKHDICVYDVGTQTQSYCLLRGGLEPSPSGEDFSKYRTIFSSIVRSSIDEFFQLFDESVLYAMSDGTFSPFSKPPHFRRWSVHFKLTVMLTSLPICQEPAPI
jgi:hypothetical protein